jgi:hypothetical protein
MSFNIKILDNDPAGPKYVGNTKTNFGVFQTRFPFVTDKMNNAETQHCRY